MRKKRLIIIIIPLFVLFLLLGKHSRYTAEFYDVFDTHTVVVGYARSQREFQKYVDVIHSEMLYLHRQFDIYNDYVGVSNLKTVNDSAGVAPVAVEQPVLELLKLAAAAYRQTGGTVNAAMGSVLCIWHEYRERGLEDGPRAALPPMQLLEEARLHTSMEDVVLDEAASTVFLRDPRLRLDVGAIAKGYAVQKAMDKAAAAGFSSGFISAGGNVSVTGKPKDGRDLWRVGIQSPVVTEDGSQPYFDSVSVTDLAVVTSGDYQRFYVVDGLAYHHIIDPETLMPADRFKAVTVLHPDSGIADMLSTAAFILPYEQGIALVERYGANAVWILRDDTLRMTAGYEAVSAINRG